MLNLRASFLSCAIVRDPFSSEEAPLLREFSFRKWLLACCIVGISVSSMFAQKPEGPATGPNESAITIGPGDVIDLSVYHVPELVLKIRVDPDGYVSLPLLGDIKLAGLTVRDAQRSISDELIQRQMVLKPEVSLFIEEYATQGITVYGEVASPGIYPLMGPHRLFDAISAAGGFTPNAGHIVTILRYGTQDRGQVIDLSGNQNQEQTNVMIHPRDTIIVSKVGVVYVLGEVNKPGVFPMANNTSMSLMKAIAMAGSTTKLASLKHAIVIRKSPEGTIEMEVSLDKIYHGKSADLQLHPEDVVFVPLSNLKNYGTMGIEAAIQAAVYSIYAAELHN